MKKNSECNKIEKKIKSLKAIRKKAKTKKKQMKKLITAEFDRLEEELYKEFDAYDIAWLKCKKTKKDIKKLEAKLKGCKDKEKKSETSKSKKNKKTSQKTKAKTQKSEPKTKVKPVKKVAKAIPIVKANKAPKKVEKVSAPPAKKTVKAPKAPTAKRPDNLKRIEGVGPKIESLLKADGIKTFKQLSGASFERLRGILDAAGTRFNVHNPTTWAEQAALAAIGNWDALKKLQIELKGGKR